MAISVQKMVVNREWTLITKGIVGLWFEGDCFVKCTKGEIPETEGEHVVSGMYFLNADTDRFVWVRKNDTADTYVRVIRDS